MSVRRRRLGALVAVTLVAAGVHAATPAGPHSWHWLHLAARQLYYVPILIAAAWFGTRATLATTALVSMLSIGHALTDWAGLPMVQAEELAQVVGFWAIGSVAAVLFERERRALEQVRRAHGETLEALASSLELRERYTGGHSRRVRDYSLLVADELGVRDAVFRESLAQGALLHDVGKIGIPDRILLKPAPLTPEERSVMRGHPELGASLVGEMAWLGAARELIRTHHERYDGSGYPRGLAGEAIPAAARIFAVADAFDALTTDRPYHAALSWEEAASTIAHGRASQFDPEAADAFLGIPFEEWSRVAERTGVRLRRSPAGSASDPSSVAAGTRSAWSRSASASGKEEP